MTQMSRQAQQRVRDKFSLAHMADEWLRLLDRPPAAAVSWPDRVRIQPPLVHPWPWAFVGPMPVLRRWYRRITG